MVAKPFDRVDATWARHVWATPALDTFGANMPPARHSAAAKSMTALARSVTRIPVANTILPAGPRGSTRETNAGTV